MNHLVTIPKSDISKADIIPDTYDTAPKTSMTPQEMNRFLEANPDSIDNWIAENAEVFGLTVQTPDDVKPDLATLRQIDSVTANAQSPAGLDDLYLRLQNAESAEEITNMIFQQGGEI